jgi:hypothetical protein
MSEKRIYRPSDRPISAYAKMRLLALFLGGSLLVTASCLPSFRDAACRKVLFGYSQTEDSHNPNFPADCEVRVSDQASNRKQCVRLFQPELLETAYYYAFMEIH